MKSGLENIDVLVLGQVMTSRTETIEEYLKFRCNRLIIVGLNGINQDFSGRRTVYNKGKTTETFPLSHINTRELNFFKLNLLLYYLYQYFMSFFSIIRLRMRFSLVIGISTFYAFISILLKRLKFVDWVIYYSIDYYPQRTFINMIFKKLDKFCIENSDIIWNLTPAISEARIKHLKVDLRASKEMIVPLTYSSNLLLLRSLDKIDRWSVAFVGTLEKLQGLQLMIEAMHDIIPYLPNIQVKVIGDGPYASELKRLVKKRKLNDHFIFYGFIKNESEVMNIISKCAIGIAPYVPIPENNAMTADPGKIKLYTFLGLPVIVTKIPSGLIIDRSGAGIAIDYDPHKLASAVVRLLSDERLLNAYRRKAFSFAESFTSENVFPNIFEVTLQNLKSLSR